jgi:hypothetical protein
MRLGLVPENLVERLALLSGMLTPDGTAEALNRKYPKAEQVGREAAAPLAG